MSEWIRKNNNEQLKEEVYGNTVSLLKFPALEETGLVKHAFSTRMGGVSKGYLSSMNLSFTKESSYENVVENYKRISNVLGIDIEDMVLSYQTHTTNILKVEKKHRGSGILKEREYGAVDALITDEKGICLVTFFADCVPIYLLDTKNKAIGLVHSGWRGTVERIADITFRAMQFNYGSRAENMIACIGPSICADHYEVGIEVADSFRRSFIDHSIEGILKYKDETHYMLDLWEANRIILEDIGISPSNIHITDICTFCNNDKLFSHRFAGDLRGNMAAFLALR